MSVREPTWAGQFYPAKREDLIKQIEECFLESSGPGKLPVVSLSGQGKIVGLMSPHAGLPYSGSTAAHCYHRMAEDGLPETIVIIGPNHRSYMPAVALAGDSSWRTPLGESQIDLDVNAEIMKEYPDAQVNVAVHYAEHSLEVQLPFIQYIDSLGDTQTKIVPILIGASAYNRTLDRDLEFANNLGRSIAEAVKGRKSLVIASTDMTHYENAETAKRRDYRAIPHILNLDEEGLLRTVGNLNMSMCGAMPTAVAISACKELGAVSTRELSYRNSGEVTGDLSEVVAYCAIEMDRQVETCSTTSI